MWRDGREEDLGQRLNDLGHGEGKFTMDGTMEYQRTVVLTVCIHIAHRRGASFELMRWMRLAMCLLGDNA